MPARECRCVVQIGGHMFSADPGMFVLPFARGIAQLVQEGTEVVVVMSDLLSVGRQRATGPLGRPGVDHRVLGAFAQTTLLCELLEALEESGCSAAHLSLSRADVAQQKSFDVLRDMTNELLRYKTLPILSENPLTTCAGNDGQHNRIDHLSGLCAVAFQAKLLVALGGCDGIQVKEGQDEGGRSSYRRVETIPDVDEFRTDAKNGGLAVKLAKEDHAILDVARIVNRFAIDVLYCKYTHSQRIVDCVLGNDSLGTRFIAGERKGKLRKAWLELAAITKGELYVSTLLAESLRARMPTSILLIGIESVIGNFGVNDIVVIKDVTGSVLGRGQVRMSSDQILHRMANRDDVADFACEVVHCDYLTIVQ